MGKVITVWGSPGSGKSMFSCILAKALTRDKRKAIIINAEISVPMLPVWLPEQIIQTNASVGQVLSSVEIDTSLVAGHVKLFIFENFREDAEHINSKSGAFFTPFGLANDFTLQIPCLYGKTIRIIDLCAGIGVLSYAAQLECSDRSRCYADITCVELNPHYVEVGKKVVPEATWICADVLDPFLPDLLGQFDFAIANPPFGRIANNYRKSYMSGEFEYMVIEAASRIAKEGAFIIPQMSAPFVYSGTEDHRWLQEGRARTFEKRTGILLEFNQGIDTAYYKNDWHCTAPICEIVCCDFAGTDTSAA